MNDSAARLTAQGKINLYLHVGTLLDSGYHAIDTLFQRIDLGDEVVLRTFSNGARREIECGAAELGPTAENLAFRAAELYSRECGWPAGFSIHLRKHIPVGGGLGGGSADAAAVLRILNHLAPAPVPQADLERLGSVLGSDVPFLVSSSPLSRGQGRGEILTPLAPLEIRGVTLFAMPFGVSTREAYTWIDAERMPETSRETAAFEGPNFTTWPDVAARGGNDFENVVSLHHPRVGITLTDLRLQDYEMTGLCGSGATVFAISKGREPVPAQGRLPDDVRQIFTFTSVAVPAIEVL